jgi:hypothetical protein
MSTVFHTDPGHGWLQVPVAELRRLGITDKISHCSYISRDGKTAYLEEDCDYSVYFRAAGLTHETAEKIPTMHTNSDSFIRSLPLYPSQED